MINRALGCLLACIAVVTIPGPPASYETSFPAGERPISEGGRWVNGGVVGMDWSDVQTVSGRAVGTSSRVAYSDPTALVAGSWGPDQAVEATVYSKNPTDRYFQEVELRLRSHLSPHRSTGYEVLFRCLKTGSAYAQIVRWNGPRGSFSGLASRSGARYGVRHGDVVKATIVGDVIRGYINGREVLFARDTTYQNGSPGLGFNYGVGDTYLDFGFTRWRATDSVKTTPITPERLASILLTLIVAKFVDAALWCFGAR